MKPLLATACLACASLLTPTAAAQSDGGAPRFNRDIRPILSENCFACHGPDARRKAGLRLDTPGGATAELDSGAGHAVVPGDPAKSVLVQRILTDDPAKRMPPRSSHKKLTKEQAETLRRWVAAGAKYEGHWAFTPPERPALPKVKLPGWARNPVDLFVLARLEREGLRPSPEAPRGTLLRRVTLDLTGLPPTPEELRAFLDDPRPDAYERAVDRLLASPRFGERMALHWLDLARYADTNGYNNDEERTMWPWRDWVLGAFNDNLPYDRFLTEQVAGDLLPGATLAQKVATGFSRNHVITTEGGVIPEEYRVEYVADRVHTTATVFLGLSMQCARCHDHKYDPLSTKEYYRFFAYFNNIEDQTVGYNSGAAARPYLKAPTRAQQAELKQIDRLLAAVEKRRQARERDSDAALAAWEKDAAAKGPPAEALSGLALHFPLDDGKGVTVQGPLDRSHRGEVKGEAKWTAGKVGGALELDGRTHVDAGQLGALERNEPFTLAAWVHPASGEAATVLSRMDEGAGYRGYDLLLEGGKVAVHLVHRWPDDAIKVTAKRAAVTGGWHHVLVSYDGSSKAAGLRVYVDGKAEPVDVHADRLTGTIRTGQPLRLGLRTSSLGFKGRIDDVRLYRAALTAEDAARLVRGEVVAGLGELLKVPAAKRTDGQKQQLRRFYLDRIDGESRTLREEARALTERRAAVDKAVPLTMVMAEQPTPRKTRVLKRGQYDAPGEEVSPGVPSALTPLPKDAPPNRLGLARWLTDPRHPLTARVAVNRYWEMLFGTGIVETSEDFGAQGAWPSHPELLDWLATEFVRGGWDVKKAMRLLVTSATYRQSSDVSRELLERDPKNRLLARGPRLRLPAETIRDSALAVSGLLREKVGGPSVKPYQPPGLWEDVSVERRYSYKADPGEGLYRRSLYTYWKRTCPPPGMTALDAPDRETCTVRRARTNTPLQALLLLNDPTYLEAARKLAERMMREGGDAAPGRLERGFTLVLARTPSAAEREVLEEVRGKALARFAADPKAAARFLAVGQSPRAGGLPDAELAAWTVVASTLLNLDEAITRE